MCQYNFIHSYISESYKKILGILLNVHNSVLNHCTVNDCPPSYVKAMVIADLQDNEIKKLEIFFPGYEYTARRT